MISYNGMTDEFVW